MVKVKKVNIKSKKIKISKYKSAMKNLDKNNDKFISINEYLDNELSLGPSEYRGNNNYHYQNYGNVYNYFFLIKLKEMKKYKVLCIPDYKIRYGNKYIVRTSIVINVYDNSYIIPYDLKNLINKCRDNKEHILIYLNCILIYNKNNPISHANMVILNLKKKTIERYEPFGCSNKNKEVDIIVKNMIDDIGINDYKYLSPSKISPLIGIQYKSDSYGGMCVTISMLYLQLRILNINKSQKQIINYLLKKNSKEMKNIILRFAKYVQKKLNKYDTKVKYLDDTLYRGY